MSEFDLVRLTKAKKEVDISPNTIREYARQGLNLYRQGKAVFFSRAELATFIRSNQKRTVKSLAASNMSTDTVICWSLVNAAAMALQHQDTFRRRHEVEIRAIVPGA